MKMTIELPDGVTGTLKGTDGGIGVDYIDNLVIDTPEAADELIERIQKAKRPAEQRTEKQYVPDALAEAKDWYTKAWNLPGLINREEVKDRLMFAQTAALIAIAEALTKE